MFHIILLHLENVSAGIKVIQNSQSHNIMYFRISKLNFMRKFDINITNSADAAKLSLFSRISYLIKFVMGFVKKLFPYFKHQLSNHTM